MKRLLLLFIVFSSSHIDARTVFLTWQVIVERRTTETIDRTLTVQTAPANDFDQRLSESFYIPFDGQLFLNYELTASYSNQDWPPSGTFGNRRESFSSLSVIDLSTGGSVFFDDISGRRSSLDEPSYGTDSFSASQAIEVEGGKTYEVAIRAWDNEDTLGFDDASANVGFLYLQEDLQQRSFSGTSEINLLGSNRVADEDVQFFSNPGLSSNARIDHQVRVTSLSVSDFSLDRRFNLRGSVIPFGAVVPFGSQPNILSGNDTLRLEYDFLNNAPQVSIVADSSTEVPTFLQFSAFDPDGDRVDAARLKIFQSSQSQQERTLLYDSGVAETTSARVQIPPDVAAGLGGVVEIEVEVRDEFGAWSQPSSIVLMLPNRVESPSVPVLSKGLFLTVPTEAGKIYSVGQTFDLESVALDPIFASVVPPPALISELQGTGDDVILYIPLQDEEDSVFFLFGEEE